MPKGREKYYAERNKRVINFVLDDEELKQRIADAAAADGRSVSGWIKHHILPDILKKAGVDPSQSKPKASKPLPSRRKPTR